MREEVTVVKRGSGGVQEAPHNSEGQEAPSPSKDLKKVQSPHKTESPETPTFSFNFTRQVRRSTVSESVLRQLSFAVSQSRELSRERELSHTVNLQGLGP